MVSACLRCPNCGSEGPAGDRRAVIRRADFVGGTYPKLQAAVGPFFAVLLLPRRDLPPCIEQFRELARVQALVLQLPVETFHVRVLRRPPRLDVHQVTLPLDAPGQKMPTG